METISDMAIPRDVDGGRGRAGHYLTRIVICILGLAGVAWGGFTLPLFWHQAAPKSVASKLIQGQPFKRQWLLDEARQAESAEQYPFCDPSALHNLVVLRLAILNDSIAANDQALVASSYQPLYDAARRALSCSPSDPFVWLTLFWLDVRKHGLTTSSVNYLRLSYRLGPNESWIALWRNKLALALFDRLPADLAKQAIDEFVGLLNTRQLTRELAGVFEGAPTAAQKRIVAQLDTADDRSRRWFAKALYDKGLDVAIPGIESPAARPWEFALPPASNQ